MLSRMRAGGMNRLRPNADQAACMERWIGPSSSPQRRSIKAGIIALAVLAGIVAGAVLVYTPLGDQLLTFLGFTYPKDCG
jgi:hypothetical protein